MELIAVTCIHDDDRKQVAARHKISENEVHDLDVLFPGHSRLENQNSEGQGSYKYFLAIDDYPMGNIMQQVVTRTE